MVNHLGSSVEIGKSGGQEILIPIKEFRVEPYFVYGPLGIPQSGDKISAHSRRQFA